MVDHLSRRHRPVSQVPQGRPVIPGDLGPASSARGVNQMSLATRALLRWHVGSTSCPRRLGLMSEGPRCRPPLPGDSGSGLRAHRVDHLFWVSRLAPSALGVNQLSRATWASVRGPAWSTICPERHKLVSQVPRDRPDIPGDPGLGSSTRGVNYLSLPNWALLRWQAVSTRSPG